MRLYKSYGVGGAILGLLVGTVLGQEMPACAVSHSLYTQCPTLILEDRVSRDKSEGADHLRPNRHNMYMYDAKLDGCDSRMCTVVMYLDRGVV
jgi:hypothetical protein